MSIKRESTPSSSGHSHLDGASLSQNFNSLKRKVDDNRENAIFDSNRASGDFTPRSARLASEDTPRSTLGGSMLGSFRSSLGGGHLGGTDPSFFDKSSFDKSSFEKSHTMKKEYKSATLDIPVDSLEFPSIETTPSFESSRFDQKNVDNLSGIPNSFSQRNTTPSMTGFHGLGAADDFTVPKPTLFGSTNIFGGSDKPFGSSSDLSTMNGVHGEGESSHFSTGHAFSKSVNVENPFSSTAFQSGLMQDTSKFRSPLQIDPHGQFECDKVNPRWITIFGFPPDKASYILRQFSHYGEILQYHISGNWMDVEYRTQVAAQKALAKNGKIYDSKLMIGVVECLNPRADSPQEINQEPQKDVITTEWKFASTRPTEKVELGAKVAAKKRRYESIYREDKNLEKTKPKKRPRQTSSVMDSILDYILRF